MKGLAALVTSQDEALGSHAVSRFFARRQERGPKSAAAPVGEPPGKGPPEQIDLEPTIYRFILRYSLPQQFLLLALTVASFPFLYYSVDLPKTIVNNAIAGKHLQLQIFGAQFGRISYLLTLCTFFLVLVFINGGFKFYINTLKGRLGERMLRRFRYQLYLRMLHFQPVHFIRAPAAQLIPMITAECEPLGGFIGDAFVTPAFQGGTLLTLILFMFIQDPILGAAAVALYPAQAYVIPKLQRKVNQLGRRRVRTIRQVADRVQESASGIVDIVANDIPKLQLTGFAYLLGTIYDIRYEIYQRKYFVKFLNNFIAQLTPFFFYSIGGYLVIRHQLSLGALVAVLAAYKDLSPPWRELLNFYQSKEDSRIKYEQIVEQFATGTNDLRLLDEPEVVPALSGELAVSNLSLAEDDKSRIVDGVGFTLPPDAHIAIVGQSGSGKSELALLLARLMEPTGGRITIGGIDLATLPVAVTGRRLGYVGTTPYLFAGSLRDNLLLSLRHRPLRPVEYEPALAKRRAVQIYEARRSGNIEFDIHADWTDYEAAGVSGRAELSTRIAELLKRVDFDADVYGFGLRWRLDPEAQPQIAERLLEARRALARRLGEEGIESLVETYDPERFNHNASVAENLLFGTPIGPAFEFDALAGNAYVQRVLAKVGLADDLVEAGRQVAETMVELFADLPPGHEFFEQYSFISANELPDFSAILARCGKGGVAGLAREDRTKLLSLPFKLVAARHRLDVLDERMQRRLLEARRVFRADLPPDLQGQIEFFDAERYNAAASVQDNILFGKIAYGEGDALKRVPEILAEVIDSLSLRQTIIDIGLDYQVGTGGSRLSLAQRQKAAIARALLKHPDWLILNEATSALDGPAQSALTRGLREELEGRGLIWALHRASLARNLDRVLVMSGGKLAEEGSFAELDRKDSLMSLLIAAE